MALIHKHGTGDLREGSRLLGHKRTDTTTKFYDFFETLHATEKFGILVSRLITEPAAEGNV